MNPLIRSWLDQTSTPTWDHHFEQLLPRLTPLSEPGLALVLDLGIRFWVQRPLRLPYLSPGTALDLALLAYERNIGDPHVGTSEEAAERARAVFSSHQHRTEAEAALAAIKLVPNVQRALRPWHIEALRDFEHSETPPDVLTEVRTQLRNTAPGADYAEVGGLRWVVWRFADQPR